MAPAVSRERASMLYLPRCTIYGTQGMQRSLMEMLFLKIILLRSLLLTSSEFSMIDSQLKWCRVCKRLVVGVAWKICVFLQGHSLVLLCFLGSLDGLRATPYALALGIVWAAFMLPHVCGWSWYWLMFCCLFCCVRMGLQGCSFSSMVGFSHGVFHHRGFNEARGTYCPARIAVTPYGDLYLLGLIISIA